MTIPTLDKDIEGHRCVFRPWTYGMKQEVLRKATKFTTIGDETETDVDPWVLNDNMLLKTLVEWDLKDENGQPLQITIENIHNQKPELIEGMIEFAQSINGVQKALKKK